MVLSVFVVLVVLLGVILDFADSEAAPGFVDLVILSSSRRFFLVSGNGFGATGVCFRLPGSTAASSTSFSTCVARLGGECSTSSVFPELMVSTGGCTESSTREAHDRLGGVGFGC